MPIVTLQDIANQCGLNKSTVSRALAKHPKISVATQKRVESIAHQLGYQRDPVLAKVASFRWKHRRAGEGSHLAVIHCEHPDHARKHLHVTRLGDRDQALIRQCAQQHGYTVDVHGVGWDSDIRQRCK